MLSKLEIHQKESWAAYLGTLVDICARKYLAAADLVNLDLFDHPKLYDYKNQRINLFPIQNIWEPVCIKYNRYHSGEQGDIFIGMDAPEILFSNYIHWKLWPALTEDNEFVRNILRAVDILISTDPSGAAEALKIMIENHRMPGKYDI